MQPAEVARVTTFSFRVAYVDTDQGGIMHHSMYLRYLEAARVEHLRVCGVDYRSLERDQRLGFAVVEANLRYKLPARFDDLLEIRSRISGANRAKAIFESEIVRGAELLTSASITVCCIRLPEARICSVPQV